MSLARSERHALVRTMSEVGPDAPTLCGDWTVRDLAAHLLVRERRVDAMPGIVVPALADHTEKVRRSATDRQWAHLLADVDSGPPKWSPMFLFDAVANAAEMFVHHEDVRRAQPGWEPRTLSADDQDQLWRIARMIGRNSYGGCDVTVVFERSGSGERVTLRKRGPRTVVLRGEPAELVLHAFGRDQVRLEIEGDESAVTELAGSKRGL
ncbi:MULTISPECIES: TIGR03085 family metal-binding protein [Rhodococcus]|uniref:TIGR03085 family metal-binding protein n=1 Tax=Rhodococcus rhodochrous TaxID=1829 RepID=UPI000E755EA4|nr:TIGR03085 family metal-binding protein [Rhodococcus rhodochrous]QHG83974.1 TIGR03085 family protein [Rhodococcus rhodochrous]QOH56344.1 TIGR03085 family protein [Rhodococcus rhodochrous]